MKKAPEFKSVELAKIGPMVTLEGDFIFHPNRSYPLDGYVRKEDEDFDSFFNSLEQVTTSWFEKFPNCCDNHRRFLTLEGFNKDNYGFIPEEIQLNVRYFLHCFESFISHEHWFKIISQYYDYLNLNLGNPGIGTHIFNQAIDRIIESHTIKDYLISDDKRMALIEHMYPSKESVAQRRKQNGDIAELYPIFEKWLKLLPNIGEIADLKKRLSGKFPMTLFLFNTEVNQFNRIATSNVKSNEQLIADLEQLTKTILLNVESGLKEDFLKEQKMILNLSEEKLKIRQSTLFGNANRNESSLKNIVSEWLDMWIEYFNNLQKSYTNKKLEEILRNTNSFVHQYLNQLNLLDSSIALLKKDLSNLIEKIDENIILKTEVICDKINESILQLKEKDSEFEKILTGISDYITNQGDEASRNVVKSLQKSNVSLKHKVTVGIPIFLFTKFKTELELGATDKIPSNLKELKELFIKTKQ